MWDPNPEDLRRKKYYMYLVEVFALPFEDIFGSVAEVDELVDEPTGHQVKRALSSLVKIKGHKGIHSNA